MTSIRSFVKKLFQKEDFITVVSGLPRSGTSMMMSALKAGGMAVLTDEIRSADKNNPKGYFEFERVKKLPKGDTGWVRSAQGKSVKIISALLGYLPDDFRYRVIFMERNIEEILASQQRMLERNSKQDDHPMSDDDLRQSYQDHLKEQKAWLADQDWIQTLHISYNDVLREPEKVFIQVAGFLDQRVDPLEMVKVVDPDLYREQK
jgi:hypothetical protein